VNVQSLGPGLILDRATLRRAGAPEYPETGAAR